MTCRCGQRTGQPNAVSHRAEPRHAADGLRPRLIPRVRHQGSRGKEDIVSKTAKVTAFLLVSCLLVSLSGACASPQPPTSTVKVPDKLKPGANESVAMIVPARGVQIYECRAKKDQVGGYEWAFVAPEADLFDARGNRIGRHYAGTHLQSTDASKS